jgi:hypothetical protein
MALTMHAQLHFTSSATLKVAETIAQITAVVAPTPPACWPAGVTLTVANGDKLWVALSRIEWIEPL